MAAEVQLAECDQETITQVVTMEKMCKKGGGKGKGKGKGGGKGGIVNPQFSANVALKVNMKMGGACYLSVRVCWCDCPLVGQNLSLYEPQITMSEPTMLCGAANSTSAPGQIRQNYAAVVGYCVGSSQQLADVYWAGQKTTNSASTRPKCVRSQQNRITLSCC